MSNTVIVLLSHGEWGSLLLSEAKKHFGLKGNYVSLPFKDNMSTEHYMEQIINTISDKDAILVSDLFPGSTSTIATRIALETGCQALYGLSLQTLLTIDSICENESYASISTNCELMNAKGCIDLIAFFKKCQQKENS